MATAKRAHARRRRATKIARGKRTSVRKTVKTVRKSARAKPKAKPHANSLTKPLPRPHGNRLVFSPELLADGKRRYETTPETLDSIALDFSSNRSTLKNVAKREGWKRYVPPPRGLSRAAEIAAEAEKLEASLSLPPRSGGEGGSGAQERDGVGWGDASAGLPPPNEKALPTPNPSPPCEARTGGGEKSAAPPATPLPWSLRERIDALRNAVDEEIAAVRALRAKLKGVPHGKETAGRTSRTLADLTATLERLHRLEIGAPQHERQDTYDDMPADLDEFRDELARRIRAFVASRTGARDADGSPGPAAVDQVR
jgi:hypothetical protein